MRKRGTVVTKLKNVVHYNQFVFFIDTLLNLLVLLTSLRTFQLEFIFQPLFFLILQNQRERNHVHLTNHNAAATE